MHSGSRCGRGQTTNVSVANMAPASPQPYLPELITPNVLTGRLTATIGMNLCSNCEEQEEAQEEKNLHPYTCTLMKFSLGGTIG